MKRNWVLLLLVMLVVAACGGRDRDSAEPTPTTAPPAVVVSDEPVVVRFAVSDFEMGTFTNLVRAFEDENPSITIEMVSADAVLGLDSGASGAIADDANLRLAQAADVFTSGVPIGDYRGVTRDLTPFLEQDTTLSAADFYPGTLQPEADGRLLLLPIEVEYSLLVYDRELFDAAGVAYPQPGWTWDEMRAVANLLTLRAGGETTQWGLVLDAPELAVYGRLARPLVDTSVDPAAPRYQDDDVVAAVRWVSDLFLVDGVAPFETAPDDGTPFIPRRFQLIDQGRVAMWTENVSSFSFGTRLRDVGAVPFPVGAGQQRTTPFVTSGYFMSAGTANPAAAWAWMAFLSGQEQPGFAFGGQTALPARRSVAEAGGFWDDVNPRLTDALRAAVESGFNLRQGIGYVPLRDALEAIIDDGQDVAAALAEAQISAETDIAEADAARAAIPTFSVIDRPAAAVDPNAETITFIVAGGAFDLGQYRDLADEFTARNPSIVIDVRAPNLSGDTISFSTLTTGGDCFQSLGALDDPEFLATLLPLDPLADADPTFDRSDFFPALLAQFTVQGQLWGLPAELNPTLIEYNRDLFDAAGVDYPAVGWTLDDFTDKALALTEGDGPFKTYGFVPDAFELVTMLSMLELYGATLIDDSEDVPTVTFASPELVAALRWYVSLARDLGVKPSFVTDPSRLTNDPTTFIEREGIIDEGRAAMWTTFGPAAGPQGLGLGNRAAMNIGVAPFPAGSGGSGVDQSSGYFVSADTPHRRACWEWITFLTSSPDAVQGLPGRISVAQSAAYRQRVGAERADAYIATVQDAGESTIFRFFGSSQGGWLGPSVLWLGRAHSQAVKGELSVEDALADAQALFDSYRSCVIADDAFADTEAQNDCLAEVDPSLSIFFGGQ